MKIVGDVKSPLQIRRTDFEREFELINVKRAWWVLVLFVVVVCVPVASIAQKIPDGVAIDGVVGKVMARTHAHGMAVAVVDHGKVGYVHAYGIRNAKGDPLTRTR